jgi:DnaJ-class molecular chaperone
MGLTRDEAYKAIEGYYKQKTKKRHDAFQFLKAEYRPHDTIKNKKAFANAITSKATITHSSIGKYSTPIRRKYKVCSMCGGNRQIENIEHIMQVCPKCGGSGSMETSH